MASVRAENGLTNDRVKRISHKLIIGIIALNVFSLGATALISYVRIEA